MPTYRIIDAVNLDRGQLENLDALPRGLHAPYLLVIESPYDGVWIAKQWKRRLPATLRRGEAIIRF